VVAPGGPGCYELASSGPSALVIAFKGSGFGVATRRSRLMRPDELAHRIVKVPKARVESRTPITGTTFHELSVSNDSTTWLFDEVLRPRGESMPSITNGLPNSPLLPVCVHRG